jgi:uncharacterized protein
MRPELLGGARLFNAGEYWEAHEVWEVPWNAAKMSKDLVEANYVQGLILLSAALHKRWHYDNAVGGQRNYDKALRRLEGIDSEYSARDGIDLEALKLEVLRALADRAVRPQLPLV